MLSQKQKDFDEHLLCLERFVPQDNFYRQLEAKLDLSFVYGADSGEPIATDPPQPEPTPHGGSANELATPWPNEMYIPALGE